MPRVFFASFDGCYANEAEGELIQEFLEVNGFDVVTEPTTADLLVYNSCAFDRPAEDRSLEAIDRVRRQARPGADVLVTGCLPGINPDRLARHVTARTVTPRTLDSLDGMLGARVRLREVRMRRSAASARCLISIATGCLGGCTFCGIKNAIGAVRSRGIEEILEEFDRHRRAGRSRFVLASHDFGAYGRDLGLDAINLLRAVLSRPGDFKVEIEWIDPKWLSLMLDGFIEMLQTGKLAKYFYVSLQSGSERILRLMGRQYTPDDVRRCLGRLTREVPDFRPQIEFIVGFPGETEAEFRETLALVREFVFLDVNVYRFDPKPGTAAATMPDPVPAAVIDRRFHEARALAVENRTFAAVSRFRTRAGSAEPSTRI